MNKAISIFSVEKYNFKKYSSFAFVKPVSMKAKFKVSRLIILCCMLNWFASAAQLIIQKNGKFGMLNPQSGETILEQKYDNIYQIQFDLSRAYGESKSCQSPIYVCLLNGQYRIYNLFDSSFSKSAFDEIRLLDEFEESMHPYPAEYKPGHVDCVLLRKGKYWGYIAHPKEYHFSDRLELSDKFFIIEPQYDWLGYVMEENGYTSHEYARRKRIVTALKDSLYGALRFETGQVEVPFRYKLPITGYFDRFDRRGLEFFSTQGGMVPYFVARKNFESKEQIIINATGHDAGFDIDYKNQMDIYSEYGSQNVYVESLDTTKFVFDIWDYNTGRHVFHYDREPDFTYFKTGRENESILSLEECSDNGKRCKISWFNLTNGKLILYKEGKYGDDIDFEIKSENDSQIVYFKGKKRVGKITGEGNELKIEWVKKVFLKEPVAN